jgi:thymidine kinase
MTVEKCNKHVVVSGLDGDSNRNPFGDLIKLIPICDTVDKLTAYCIKCNDGTLGPFTKKISNSDCIVDIGGIDKYIPVCRNHYHI